MTNTYPWKLCTLTHRENGTSSNRTLLGGYFKRQHALNDACRIASQLAGPERDGYRRPTVKLRDDETLGECWQVGDAAVDPEYTLVYPIQNSWR